MDSVLDGARFDCIFCEIEASRQRWASPVGAGVLQHVVVGMSLGVSSGEGRVNGIDGGELEIPSYMVEVGVGIEHDDQQGREPVDDGAEPSDPQPGVEWQSALPARNQIGQNLLFLPGFVERVDVSGQLVDVKPSVGDGKLFVMRECGALRLRAAPKSVRAAQMQPLPSITVQHHGCFADERVVDALVIYRRRVLATIRFVVLQDVSLADRCDRP